MAEVEEPTQEHKQDCHTNGERIQDRTVIHGSSGPQIDLDWVLVNELGQFGRFQLTNILLAAFPIMASAFVSEYIFSAAAVSHRCHIPECGESAGAEYEFLPEWILNAVPSSGSGGQPVSCERFVPTGNGSLDYCPETAFDQALTQACDGFVYEKTNSVAYEFNLGCQEWMRTLAGTLSSVGALLSLPIAGYVSDNYGRRVALSISVFNLALFGLIRAFSVNYPMYLALQIIQTTLAGGTMSAAYIFATEMVGPKYRVLTTCTCSSLFATGLIIMGGMAWLVQPWRYYIMALFVPCFLLVVYYWVLWESVRWLLSKEKYSEAKVALERVARMNKTTISEKSMQALMTPRVMESNQPKPSDGLFRTIIKSPVLLRRVCTTPVWWSIGNFVYYGLSINSTTLPGNMYVNFMLTAAVEIPAYFTALLTLDRFGRKATLATGFFLSAICNIILVFIDINELVTLGVMLSLVGKFGIGAVFPSLYLYTAELYPTQYRHSLLGFSSMIGRVGLIIAPMTPALAVYWAGTPSAMFGGMGVLAGALVLTQPETRGCRMPDTLQEAEAIGRTTKQAVTAL